MTNATTSLNQARVGNLADMVRGIIAPFTTARDENVLAREQAQGASVAEVNAREVIIVALAEFSQSQQLTNDEVKAVAAKVVSGHNDVESAKAIEQFMGECRRGMFAGVRARVPELVRLRDLCWDAETEQFKADKTEPTPLRAAFKRKYHMMLALFDAQAVGTSLTTPEDVLRFADFVAEKQRTDTSKVLKVLENITKQLVNFHKDFPVDDISVCIEALQGIDAKQLKASRPKSNVVNLPAKNVVAPKAHTEEVVAETVAEVSPTVVDDTSGGDILDEMLGEGDITTLAA